LCVVIQVVNFIAHHFYLSHTLITCLGAH
jgi:hypothetical protein